MSEFVVDGTRLLRELTALSAFTQAKPANEDEPASEGTAVTRIVFSREDLAARLWLRNLAQSEGFGWRVDAVGNTFIRLEGTDASLPAVATGSHIDAIPHAGMYDGTVGVLGGLEALRAISASGLKTTGRLRWWSLRQRSQHASALGVWVRGSWVARWSLRSQMRCGR